MVSTIDLNRSRFLPRVAARFIFFAAVGRQGTYSVQVRTVGNADALPELAGRCGPVVEAAQLKC